MRRFLTEFRAEITDRKLVGHAAVFGQLATIGGTYERVADGAFDQVLANPDTDVRALINHDARYLLGRQSAGTLRLATDREGLRFEVDLPDTSYANDLRELASRGDLTGASFGFVPGEVDRDRAPDGRQVLTHRSVAQLVDVSPVTFPAYDGASVALRHITFHPSSSRRSQLIIARHRARRPGGQS